MSTTNIRDEFQRMKDSLLRLNFSKVSDDEAMGIVKEIVDAIPAELRPFYPDDDVLAAVVFAETYYRL